MIAPCPYCLQPVDLGPEPDRERRALAHLAVCPNYPEDQ